MGQENQQLTIRPPIKLRCTSRAAFFVLLHRARFAGYRSHDMQTRVLAPFEASGGADVEPTTQKPHPRFAAVQRFRLPYLSCLILSTSVSHC